MSASNITIGAANVSLWTTFILKKFVPGLKARLFFTDYAKPAMLPGGAGHYTARWLVPTMRIGSVTPLTDGSSGVAGNLITITGVEATIQDYGEWCNLTDLARQSELSKALDSYREILEYAGAGSINKMLYNAAATATYRLHAADTATDKDGGSDTLTTSDKLTAQDFPVVAEFFHTNNADGFESLGGDYMMAIHPRSELNLVTDVTTTRLSWSEVNKHVPAGFDQLVKTHRYVGRLGGVTALRTTLVGTVVEDTGVTAYQGVALAEWGIGWIGLGESGPRAPQIKIKQPGPQSTNDPLDTNGTLGWKVRMASKNLDVAARSLSVYSAI